MQADPVTPDIPNTRSKTMKNVKVIVFSGILVLAMSVSAFAKGGTISATKAGTISATRTGTISATATGTNSSDRSGTISATRAGLISATRQRTSGGLSHGWLLELLLMVY